MNPAHRARYRGNGTQNKSDQVRLSLHKVRLDTEENDQCSRYKNHRKSTSVVGVSED